jgi:hypothetical protein
VLDRQSGVLHSGGSAGVRNKAETEFLSGLRKEQRITTGGIEANIGGCSKILHVCDYDRDDFDVMQYCAKVSQAERKYNSKKFVSSDIVLYLCSNENDKKLCETSIIQKENLVLLLDSTAQFQKKDIGEFGVPLKSDLKWNIELFGKRLLEVLQKDSKFITLTKTNSITTSQIYSLLLQHTTKESILGVSLEMTDGGNLVVSVEASYMSLIITEANKGGSLDSVNPVELRLLLSVNGKEKRQEMHSDHPTVKPLSILTHILKLFRTPNAQVVLDCFMGSGSTGVACKQLGMGFIGCELDSDYFAIAQKRIEKAVLTIQTKLL